jgi:hypothetical protein
MIKSVDRQACRGGFRPIRLQGDGRPDRAVLGVVIGRDEHGPRPAGAADWSAGERLRAALAGLLLLIAAVLAARAAVVVFSPAFSAAARAIPEGTIGVTDEGGLFLALASERDRMGAALVAHDGQIAMAGAGPGPRAAWDDLGWREAAALEQLERDLEQIRRSHPPTGPAGRAP